VGVSFHASGLILTAAVLAPNLLMLFRQPVQVPEPAARPRGWAVVLAAEAAGRIGCFVLPVFRPFPAGGGNLPLAVLMGFCLAVYWFCWIRYVRRGCAYRLLFAPLLGIPVPMAVFPVLYFILAGAWIGSVPLLAAGILLGLGHVPESLRLART